MKIIFFGDSLIQGIYGANFVNKVAAQLRGHHFINQGVNGDTSLNLYRRVEKDVIQEKPDGVFLMVGVNDAASYSNRAVRSYYRFRKGVRGGRMAPISFRENMRTILIKLRFAQIKTWVALPPVEQRPALVNALREMNDYAAELCAEMKIPVLDLMAQMTPAQVPERPAGSSLSNALNNTIRSLSYKAEDFDKLREAEGYSFSFDGVHLTEDGAQQVADMVTTFLRQNGVSG